MRSTAAQSPGAELLVAWFGERPLVGARLPVPALTRAQKAAELQRVVAAEAMTAAYKAELVMGLADDTPDSLDPPPGHPGAKGGPGLRTGHHPVRHHPHHHPPGLRAPVPRSIPRGRRTATGRPG